jgi:hypothetical protein
MWMLRLLSPAEAEKPPGQVIEPGRNKIKLKPSAVLPPSNVNAKAIVEKFESTIEAMHAATGGQLDQIHFILSCVAESNGKPPPPPNTVVLLLELEKEDLAEPNVRVSIVQLLKSFQKLVKPDDSEANFEEKVPSFYIRLLPQPAPPPAIPVTSCASSLSNAPDLPSNHSPTTTRHQPPAMCCVRQRTLRK